MPRRSVVSTLPPEIRAGLDRRLRAAGYGDLVPISAWLTQLGHPLRKSALGEYALQLRKADQAAPATRDAAAPLESGEDDATPPLPIVAARTGALIAAALTGPASGLLERATGYVRWLLRRDRSEGGQ